jgi:hypothetical protein
MRKEEDTHHSIDMPRRSLLMRKEEDTHHSIDMPRRSLLTLRGLHQVQSKRLQMRH